MKKKAANSRNLPLPALHDGPGRPGLYCKEHCLIVERLAAQGATNEDIAKAIGIGVTTLHEWRRRYPDFRHSFKKYRGIADMEIENSLFKAAKGFNYKEEGISAKGDVVEVTKYATPSVNAIKFYLTNRMPDRYKNKVEQTLQLGADVEQMVVAIKRREE